jgi:putative aldouronate transport system substrate-binding protein
MVMAPRPEKRKEVLTMRHFFMTLFVLTVLPAALLFAGGQTDDDGEAAEIEEQGFVGYSLPIVDDGYTLSFLTREAGGGVYPLDNDLPVFQALEDKTGITIDFETTPSGQYDEVAQTRLAAGINLPDIVRLPGAVDPMFYAESGVIISLTSMIESYGTEMLDLFDERPVVRKEMTAPDGEIYFIPDIKDARAKYNYASMSMRKDWLEDLGLDEPVTIDDWHEVLIAFRDQDANGNGDPNDEVPFFGLKTDILLDSLTRFAWAYDLYFYKSDGWYPDDDGNVQYQYITQDAKDWITTMHQWYSEGLISEDILTANNDQWVSYATNGTGGATANWTMHNPQWNGRIEDGYWQSVLPVQGPDGHRAVERDNATLSSRFAITSSAEDPDIALKWLDYMWASDEGIRFRNFGIEGLSYTITDAGQIAYTDFVTDHERGSGFAFLEIGAYQQVPQIMPDEAAELRFTQTELHRLELEKAIPGTEYYVPSFPNVIATQEEAERFTEIMTDVRTFTQEMFTKFFLGVEPIENFDQYVQTIRDMGIDEAIEIRQSQYDRFQQF